MTNDKEIERKVIEVLDGLGLPYEVVDIDPAYADTAQFCERYGFAMDKSGNTIIVASKKEPRQYAACVVKATRRLDVNHTVRKLMGVPRLSFATAEETTALTGMLIGGVTVFALPPELPIYVDDTLLECDQRHPRQRQPLLQDPDRPNGVHPPPRRHRHPRPQRSVVAGRAHGNVSHEMPHRESE